MKEAQSSGLKNLHLTILGEGSWILAVVFVFSLSVALLSLTTPLYLLLIYERVISSGSIPTLVSLLILAVFCLVCMTILDYCRRRLLARFGALFQQKLEPHLLVIKNGGPKDLGVKHLDNFRSFCHSGDFISIIDGLWLPIYILVIFLINPLIGYVIVGILFTIGLSSYISKIFSYRREKIFAEVFSDTRAAKHRILSVLENFRGVRFGEASYKLFIEHRNSSRNASLHATDLTYANISIINLLRMLGTIGVLSIGAMLVLTQTITTGGMIACFVLANRTIFPFQAFIKALPKALDTHKSWKHIAEAMAGKNQNNGNYVRAFNSSTYLLELHGVDIYSSLSSETVLGKVHFSVSPSDCIVISGDSGSGKSCLADVISWSKRPSSGMVKFQGNRASAYSDSQLASMVGYVPEQVIFFKGTIAENISSLESSMVTREVEEVANQIGIHELILTLPDGYETQIDVFGATLPRFLREKIILARALYGNPKLLVIDEPSDTLLQDELNIGYDRIHNFLENGGAMIVLSRRHIPSPFVTRSFVIENSGIVEVKPNPKQAEEINPPAPGVIEHPKLMG